MSERGKAEEVEGAEGPAPASAGSVAAVALAMARRRGGKADEGFDAFLDVQRRLAETQLEHLHEERALQHRHMRLKFFGDRLKIGLQLLTIAVGGAVAIGAGVVVWSASQANGLVIKPFSVPPALAERGVTGEAVASGLIDRFSAMAAVARSGETQRQVAADTGGGVKIEIPETGLSLSQVDQWLVDKLGHERRISGEVIAGPGGTLTLVARSGSDPLPEQSGPEADLPALLQKTAESLYAREQPGSYGGFLNRSGRFEELRAFNIARTASPDPLVRARGYYSLSGPNLTTDAMEQKRLLEKAIAIGPHVVSAALDNLAGAESGLGHEERAYQLGLLDAAHLRDPAYYGNLSAQARRQYQQAGESGHLAALQDWNGALAMDRQIAGASLLGFDASYSPQFGIAIDLGALHDVGEARRILADYQPENDQQKQRVTQPATMTAIAAEDWPAAWTAWQAAATFRQGRTDKGAYDYYRLALGADILIGLRKLDEAQAMLDPLPLDCWQCVITRGELAAARGDSAQADHWFSEAVRMAPSLSLASQEWGKALLDRKDYAGAIARFTVANQRSPNWADPLEGWGEALLGKGDAGGAAGKFEAAEKLAPNWGRLHLIWGEALARQGKADQAQAQWRKAGTLFLTPAETARLAGDMKGGHA